MTYHVPDRKKKTLEARIMREATEIKKLPGFSLIFYVIKSVGTYRIYVSETRRSFEVG